MKKMKAKASLSALLFAIIAGGLILVNFGISSATSKSETGKKPIVIGWTATLSGPMATTVDIHRVFSRLVDYVNKEEGGIAGHPIKLIVADTESSPTKAVIGAKKLIMEDKVQFLLGDRVTGICIPVGLVSYKYDIVHWAIPGANIFDIKMKQAGPEVYRWNFCCGISVSLEDVIVSSYKLQNAIGKKKVFVLYPETSFGKGMFGFYKKNAKKFGIDIVGSATYPPNANIFGPQIAAIRATNPEIIFNLGADHGSALSLAAVRDSGLKLPIHSLYSLTTPDMVDSEKIRAAYLKEPALYVTGSTADCWESVPKDDPRRIKLEEWSKLHEKFFGEKIVHSLQADGFALMDDMKALWGRLLKDHPDILNKDLDTIRSTVRDYAEIVQLPITHGGLYKVTPEDHNGMVMGTCFVGMQFSWPPTYTYMPGCEAATPPWAK